MTQQIDPVTIIALFEATFSANDTNIVKESQKRLWELACSPSFPGILSQIISISASKEVKNSAAVYLKKLSHRYVKEEVKEHLEKLLEICWNILKGQHSIKIKKEVASAIQHVVRSYPSTYLLQMMEIMNKQLGALATQFDIFRLEAVIMVSNALVSIEVEDIERVGIAILNIITESYQMILALIEDALKREDHQVSERRLETALQINKLILKHFKLGNFLKHKEYIQIISKESLAKNIWMCLQLPLPLNYSNSLQQLNPSSLFTSYNTLRSTTIQIIYKLLLKLNFLKSHFGIQIHQIIEKNPLYNLVLSQTEIFKFILPLVSGVNINQLPKSIIECVQATLRLLTLLLMDHKLQNFFLTNKQIFVYQIALPLLNLTDKQFEDYLLDPEEFINYLFHSMPSVYKPNLSTEEEEEQGDMILSGYACQFLKSYCTFQHGTLVEIFTACSQKLTSGTEQEKQLSLIVLSSLMSEIISRHDLMEMLNVFVNSSITSFDNIKEDKHTKTLRMYLGYKYMVKFSVDYEDTAVALLKLAMLILRGQVKKTECLQLMSIELIRDLINYGTIMSTRFQQILAILTSLVNKNCHTKMIQLMSNIISQYFQIPKFNNQELVLQIVHQLIIRIQKETLSQMPNIDIRNRCWNTIKTISYNPKFSEMSETICAEISHLYPFLEDLERIDFEEDIIIIISFFIKHSKKVTNQQFMLLKYFRAILKKNGNTMGEIFLPTCLILTHGVEWFTSHPEAFNEIFEICYLAITAEPSRKVGEPEHLQGIVTLQSALVSCQQQINPDIITKLFLFLFTKFFEKYKLDQFKQNLINCLGLLLYRAMPLMNAEDSEKTLTLLLCNYPQSCKSIYTLKTYVVALCQLLHLVQYKIIQERLQMMMNLLVDTFQMLVMTKDEIKNQDQEISQDQHQYQIFVEKQLVNKITLLDELSVVKSTIQHLSQKHSSLLSEVLKKMSKEKSDYLKSLASCINVDNKPRQIIRVNRANLQ